MSSAVIEYFTQKDAIARLALDPAPARAARRALVARARQKCDAAEAVLGVSMAEAYLLMRDALLLFQQALSESGSGGDPSATLASLRLSGHAARCVTKALDEGGKRPFPALDAELQDEDVDTFRQLGEATAILSRALAGKVLAERDLNLRRVRRIGIAAAAVLCLIIGLSMALRSPPAVASAVFPGEGSGAFNATMAVDGDVATEWLLPDATAGWLDVRVSPKRSIQRVRLTNGHNRSFNDRAVRTFRLEAFAGEHLVASANGEFAAPSPNPQPIEVPLVAAKIDRLRVRVISWFGVGAALAEVKVE